MSIIAVIGSNSFSGASFCKYLLELGHEVIGFSRSSESDKVFLPYRWIPLSDQKRFRFVKVDLNYNMDNLFYIINKEKIRIILNFAAQSMVGESWNIPEDWMRTNVLTASMLAERLRHLDFLDKYIHITTPEVYGTTEGWIKEDTQFNPSTPYAVSRCAGDMIFKLYHQTYGLPVLFTRASNVYGEGQQLYRIISRSIISLLKNEKIKLHGAGISTRSFIHINDVSHATGLILKNAPIGETYHISTNNIISINDLVVKICNKLNKNFNEHVELVNERLGKDNAYWLDSNKIRTELGWNDFINLDDGIDAHIDWVFNNFKFLQTQSFNYIHKS